MHRKFENCPARRALDETIEQALQLAGKLDMSYTVEFLELAGAASRKEAADQEADDLLCPSALLN